MPRPPLKRHSVTQPLTEYYRYIPLTQGQTAIVDASDFDWLMQSNWCAEWHPKKRKYYAARRGEAKMVWMHRLILGLEDGEIGDHKNRNTLDNRRENLRKCTAIQNGRNRGPQINNQSGYKGVCRHKKRWRATINSDGRQITVGYFDTPEEAARAYNESAKALHGEFAVFNHLDSSSIPKPETPR